MTNEAFAARTRRSSAVTEGTEEISRGRSAGAAGKEDRGREKGEEGREESVGRPDPVPVPSSGAREEQRTAARTLVILVLMLVRGGNRANFNTWSPIFV